MSCRIESSQTDLFPIRFSVAAPFPSATRAISRHCCKKSMELLKNNCAQRPSLCSDSCDSLECQILPLAAQRAHKSHGHHECTQWKRMHNSRFKKLSKFKRQDQGLVMKPMPEMPRPGLESGISSSGDRHLPLDERFLDRFE